MKARSFEELTKMIANDKSLEAEIKADPIKGIAKITEFRLRQTNGFIA